METRNPKPETLKPTPEWRQLDELKALCLSLTHTYTRTHTHTLSLSHTHTLSLSLTHIQAHTRARHTLNATPEWRQLDELKALLTDLNDGKVSQFNLRRLNTKYIC